MAQNTTIAIPAATWTQLTNSDIISITFQNVGSDDFLVKSSVGSTAPSDTNGALKYVTGQGERNIFLEDLFPGRPTGNRLFAYSVNGTIVAFSHA
jgi:hypothetical protein